MSFLRHRETHQNDLQCERARPFGHALAHRADESPVGYSWRVALQQSPLPLHQPGATLQQCRGELQESIRWNEGPHLNSLSHFRGAPQHSMNDPLAALVGYELNTHVSSTFSAAC